MVSHDQDFLDSVCTDIVHLDQKQLFYYRGSYETFKVNFAKKRVEQQRDWEKQQKRIRAAKKGGKSKKQALADEKKKRGRESGGAKGRKAAKKAAAQGGAASSDTKTRLLDRPREYVVNFELPDPDDTLEPPVISVLNVGFHYPNGPVLFKDVDFGIDMDTRIAIVGPNGVGKSTLLNLVCNELVPTEGEVKHRLGLRLSRYNQHFLDVLPMEKSAVDFLRGKYDDETYQTCRNTLGRFGLSGNAHTIPMSKLSGGQKARVVFTSIAMSHPDVIVLDEPTNNLDIESIDALCEAIKEFQGGVVLVSHDARLITRCQCTLWACEKAPEKRQLDKTAKGQAALGEVFEYGGDFDEYRDEVMEEIRQVEEAMLEKQRARQEARDAARKKKMDELEARKKARAAKLKAQQAGQ